MSNTEPVIRLNVESRGDVGLMEEKTTGILALLDAQGAYDPGRYRRPGYGCSTTAYCVSPFTDLGCMYTPA